MLLNSFRVTEFRSVQDSGWIDAEQITALIGTNESGKTNILLPLWKLNPADEGKIDLKDDLPRDKYHVYRESNPNLFLSMQSIRFCQMNKIRLRRFLDIKRRNLRKLLFPRIMMEIYFGNFHVKPK